MYTGLNSKVTQEFEKAQHNVALSKSFKTAVEGALLNSAKQNVLEATFEFAGLSEADFQTHCQELSKENIILSRYEVNDHDGRYMQYHVDAVICNTTLT